MTQSVHDHRENPSTQTRSKVIAILLAGTIVIVAAQGWLIYGLNQQLDDVNNSNKLILEQLKGHAVIQNQTEQSVSSVDTPNDQTDSNGAASPASPGRAPADSSPPVQDQAQTQGMADQNAALPSRPDPYDRFQYHDLNRDMYRDIERMRREMDAMMRDAFERHGLMDPAYPGYAYPDPYGRYGMPRRHAEPHKRLNKGTDKTGPGMSGRQNMPDPYSQTFKQQFSISDFKLDDLGDHFVARLNIPGADKQNINVNIKDRVLRVSGEQHVINKREDSTGNTVFRSQHQSSFTRSMVLPESVDPSSLKTHFDDDTLEIYLHKLS